MGYEMIGDGADTYLLSNAKVDEIEREVMLNDSIVHRFLMMQKKGRITEKEALYGMVNYLSKQNRRLEEESRRLYLENLDYERDMKHYRAI